MSFMRQGFKKKSPVSKACLFPQPFNSEILGEPAEFYAVKEFKKH